VSEQTTTIRIDREVKQRLDSEKEHPRETVGDVVRRLLDKREERKDGRPERLRAS